MNKQKKREFKCRITRKYMKIDLTSASVEGSPLKCKPSQMNENS